MDKVRWGIIGCGNVTEVKSGPAFQKIKNSELVAVMRRNGKLAEDYAHRHQVPESLPIKQEDIRLKTLFQQCLCLKMVPTALEYGHSMPRKNLIAP